jgi:hypothetical protein
MPTRPSIAEKFVILFVVVLALAALTATQLVPDHSLDDAVVYKNF